MTINYELHLEGERHIFFAEAQTSLPERKLPPHQGTHRMARGPTSTVLAEYEPSLGWAQTWVSNECLHVHSAYYQCIHAPNAPVAYRPP